MLSSEGCETWLDFFNFQCSQFQLRRNQDLCQKFQFSWPGQADRTPQRCVSYEASSSLQLHRKKCTLSFSSCSILHAPIFCLMLLCSSLGTSVSSVVSGSKEQTQQDGKYSMAILSNIDLQRSSVPTRAVIRKEDVLCGQAKKEEGAE